MRPLVLVVVAACVAACAAMKTVPLPKITEEERKLFLSDMDQAVDCIIEPKKGCHPYSYDVRRKYQRHEAPVVLSVFLATLLLYHRQSPYMPATLQPRQ